MKRNTKSIIAFLLVLCLTISTIPNNVFAFTGDTGGDYSTGGKFNQATGDADITTGTSSGTTQSASADNWAMRNPHTYTMYELEVTGKEPVHVGTYSDVDWTAGVAEYRNSAAIISEFVGKASKELGMSEDAIRAAGFRVHIYAQMNARPPRGEYGAYTIATNYNALIQTFLVNAVKRAANNLGVIGRGYAYYDVPAEADTPTLIKSYVKVVGLDANGKYILEEYKPAEVERISLDDPRFNADTGVLQITGAEEVAGGTAYINDILTSPRDLTEAEDISKLKWMGVTPEVGSDRI
jgi:hypothetical protein